MSIGEKLELREVTALEVVDLRGIHPNNVSQYMRAARDRPGVRVVGEHAERVLNLYLELPPGHGSRCHTPPYGLRMFREDRMVCEVSICWECDNIFGVANGQSVFIEFDSASSTAQKLLAELRRAVEERQSGRVSDKNPT